MPRRNVQHEVPPAVTYLAAGASLLSVATGLLVAFGLSYLYQFWNHFGIPIAVLGLDAQDYLTISADFLLLPLVGAAGVIVVMVWLHRLLHPLLASRINRRMRWVAAAVAALAGAFLLLVGLLNAVGVPLLAYRPWIAPLALILGVGLLVYASRVQRRLLMAKRFRARGALEITGAFILVSAGLFWGVHSYAAEVGVSRAEQAADVLEHYPDVALFSAADLNLHISGVTQLRCQGKDAAYRYRYDGLKLIVRSGDTLVFLPSEWTQKTGAAVVMPHTDSIRFEFTVAESTVAPLAC